MAADRPCQLCAAEGIERPASWDAKLQAGPWADLCDAHLASDAVSSEKLRTRL